MNWLMKTFPLSSNGYAYSILLNNTGTLVNRFSIMKAVFEKRNILPMSDESHDGMRMNGDEREWGGLSWSCAV